MHGFQGKRYPQFGRQRCQLGKSALNQSRCTSSWSGEQSGLEQVKVCSAVHLAFHKLEFRDLAFGLTVAPVSANGSKDGWMILLKMFCKSLYCSDVWV